MERKMVLISKVKSDDPRQANQPTKPQMVAPLDRRRVSSNDSWLPFLPLDFDVYTCRGPT